MRVQVLASGSKGNCTYVECGEYSFLIDAGISFLQIKNQLQKISKSVDDLDFILITHIHNDHIRGLASVLKKTSILLCAPEDVLADLQKKMEIPRFRILSEEFVYENIFIRSFHISHDVSCYGYLICDEGKSLVYITDTGYLNKKYFPLLKNKEIYIIEANHDEKMLMDGPYPHMLKQRIVGDQGHLSNRTTGKALAKLVGDDTRFVLLAHISEHNNDKDLALQQVKEELKAVNFDESSLFLTDQYTSTDMVEV